MRGAAAMAIAAVGLALAGVALRTAARVDAALVAAGRELAALRPLAAEEAHAAAGAALDGALPLPRLTAEQRAALARQALAARYWSGAYDDLRPARDETGAVTEPDAETRLLMANAAYRRAMQSGSRALAVAGLDEAVRQYADLLRAYPGHAAAAYNFEVAARVRAALATGAPAALPQPLPEEPAGDLPGGPTLHGHPGAPPAGTDMQRFRIVIPMSPDERRSIPERSGEGERPRRKG